jgi:hypothetical protein
MLLEAHLREQECARAYYYLSRALSIHRPLQVLSIMHDKMDHSKTASPCLASRTKSVDGFMKLPISVTGMLAHGHGDKKYAHYALDLYPADSNQTIGSIAKLLRDLERPPKSSNPTSLFRGTGTTELYAAVLSSGEECISSILVKPSNVGDFVPLPPILHVQLDNYWKDNKSRWIMCYWSLLVAKGIFEEIQVSFMLVGHTHDDIDASFGRWRMKLHKNDYPTIPLLMKSYMDMDGSPVIPALIEEVPDFKAFVKPYISDDTLIGHTKGRQFLFHRGENGNPLMQYKLRCIDENWLPEDGIQLWQVDTFGKVRIPNGIPLAVMPHPMKGHDDILKGINGFISHWTKEGQADVTGLYKYRYTYCVEYWSRIRDALRELEMEACDILFMGFWPQTRQSFEVPRANIKDHDMQEEFVGNEYYISPRSCRPRRAYEVAQDCHAGQFVLVRPAQDNDTPIWLALALCKPVMIVGHLNYQKIQVQWYKPCIRRGFESNPYENWDVAEHFKWELDPHYSIQWTSTQSILTSWKSRRVVSTGMVTVPKKQITIALSSIAHSIVAAPNAPVEASDSEYDSGNE